MTDSLVQILFLQEFNNKDLLSLLDKLSQKPYDFHQALFRNLYEYDYELALDFLDRLIKLYITICEELNTQICLTDKL